MPYNARVFGYDDLDRLEHAEGPLNENKRTQLKDYKYFVENAISCESENTLNKVYAGTILGRKLFIKNLLDNMKDEVFKKNEVAGKSLLQGDWKAEEIINSVSEYFKTDPKKKKRRKDDEKEIQIIPVDFGNGEFNLFCKQRNKYNSG